MILIMELKKVLFKYKVIFLIIIGVIFCIFKFRNDNANYIKYELNDYEMQLEERYQGHFTESKYEELLNEFNSIEKTDDFTEYIQKYNNGEISSVEFSQKASEYNNLNKINSAYGKTVQLADYVMEDTTNRYMVFQRGWYSLFMSINNTVPLIIILFSALILFANDCESRVQRLFITTPKGRRVHTISKLAAYMIITALVIFVFYLANFLCNLKSYGLPGADYPIQSLYMFLECSSHYTLLEGYLLSGLLVFLGSLLSGNIIFLTAKISNNKYLSVIIGVFVFFQYIFLPVTVLNNKYIVPFKCFDGLTLLSENQVISTLLITTAFTVILLGLILVLSRDNSYRRGKNEHINN